MFIESNGEIAIDLYIRNEGNGKIKVRTKLDGLDEEFAKLYEKVSFKLRPITWKQNNDLTRSSMINKGPGIGVEWDWVMHKEKKLCMILVGWDAKDKDGKPVPVNEANIFKLSPNVAETLLDEFDKRTLINGEERKNS